MTASHASSRCYQHRRRSILRPNHRLAPARFYSDHSPPLRCLNHVVDRTTHRDRYFPATTEAPALVPELLLLVHVVGRFYPSDRSGVFRSPDLSQFPARARPVTQVRAHARMTVFAPDGRLAKDKQRMRSDYQYPRSQGTARGFPPTKTEDWGNHV